MARHLGCSQLTRLNKLIHDRSQGIALISYAQDDCDAYPLQSTLVIVLLETALEVGLENLRSIVDPPKASPTTLAEVISRLKKLHWKVYNPRPSGSTCWWIHDLPIERWLTRTQPRPKVPHCRPGCSLSFGLLAFPFCSGYCFHHWPFGIQFALWVLS